MTILSEEAKALLNRMTREERRAQAEQALAEWKENYFQNGELPYPHWADAVLKACAEAEQLTVKVMELGGKVE